MSEPNPPTSDAHASAGTGSNGDRHTVMILEDELIIANDLRIRLESMGYAVAGIHTDGEHAIRAVKSERPELVLVDIGLHGDLDGIEAARRVRARHNVPLVFITAYSDDATRTRAMELPASAFLVKPIADEEFRGVIRSLLPAPSPQPVITAAEPSVDPGVAAPPEPTPIPPPPMPAQVLTVQQTVQRSTPPVTRRPARSAAAKPSVPASRALSRRTLEPQWKYVANTYLPRHHCVLYRDNTLGVQLQVITRTSGRVIRPRTYYYIDGVRGSFTSEPELIRHLYRARIRPRLAQTPVWRRLRSLFLR